MRADPAGAPRASRSSVAFLITAVSFVLAGCPGEKKTATHAIGGSVSGLAGSGLELRSGLGDTLSIAGNGAFAFPTPAEEGAAYAVIVTRQPRSPWQTCSVANAGGTVGGGDVTNVRVTCATNTYPLGGAVNGLAASGTLVLQVNGAGDLIVTADGTFTFAAPLASGAAYAVSVLSKPASQTCLVASGAGMMAGASVTGVQVTCTTDVYEVGGTVAGLAAGGTLVLRNNGGDDRTITADGAFTFATKVASGAAYAVTVLSGPPSQTCVVTQGSGTVGTAPVNDVVATCSTNSYAVGGTVDGLASGGTLVLRNNGGDDKTLTGDGPFTFATPVLSGAGYAVTVQSKPASQTCTVANGSGTVGVAPVTNVTVTCVLDTYAVGGSVLGLAGSGLVLHADIGTGEDLSVPAGATAFTFTKRAPSGSTVHVVVQTLPASPAETCAVSGSPVTVGTADVTSLAVGCTSAIQRWEAPTAWGGLWADGPTMIQHAWFDGTQLVETKGIGWGVQGGATPAQRRFTGLPGGSRWGAGPFGGARYQATAGDSGLDLPGDMLACAVVKPDFDPVVDPTVRVILSKGVMGQAGWTLLQRHHVFNFYYQSQNDAGSFTQANAHTPTYFPDAGVVDNGPLNPSYVVVCGGRAGDQIVVSANSYADTTVFPDVVAFPGRPLYTGATPHPLTIGAFDDGTMPYRGRVYETAVWNEPATAANVQAKLSAVLGLPAGVRYTRNREAPYRGVDGQLHGAWRHAPRSYAADAAGLDGGFLFGLQGWNRLTAEFTPAPPEDVRNVNPVIAYGEALDLWTPFGGATVVKDQLVPPGDSEQPGAERVTLQAGAGISTPLGPFDAAGPIHGMLWIRPVSASGTLRVRTTQPDAGGVSRHDVDLSTLTTGAWARIWLAGLTTDGSQLTPGTVYLENAGAGTIELYAWGVDLTQIGGGGALGAFDPGAEMYDWGGSIATGGSGGADQGSYAIDVLQLPDVPASTTATGFCLMVEAQPAPGMPWSAAFRADRSPVTWRSAGVDEVNVFVAGTGNTSVTPGSLCGWVTSAPSATCWDPSAWAAGSKHTITLCASPGGVVTLYADGTAVGSPVTGAAPPDLATGHLLVGSNRAQISPRISNWQGFVTKVAVCPAAGPGACR